MGRDAEAIAAMEQALELAERDHAARGGDDGLVLRAQKNLDGLRDHVRRKAAASSAAESMGRGATLEPRSAPDEGTQLRKDEV